MSSVETNSDAQAKRLRRRHRAERRFRRYGIAAIFVSLLILVTLMGSIVTTGLGAFSRSVITTNISLDVEALDPSGTRSLEVLRGADYAGVVKQTLRARFPEVTARKEKRDLYKLVSLGASYDLRERVLSDPSLLGTTIRMDLSLSDDADLYAKGQVSRDVPQEDRRLKDRQLDWLDAYAADGALHRRFNWDFFTSGDSREPELAGIGGAFIGTLLTLAVTLLLCFPLGVTAAIYLEEFAPKSRWTDLLEVNINNLAAVPSVIFGLLGLAIFLGVFNLPRSAPIVGGLVLAIRTLPIIIIAARSSLAAVPPSIRAAAMGNRRIAGPGRGAPCTPERHARHPHRNHHRDGASPRRNGTAADDRHGGLRGRHPDRNRFSGDRAARSDLPMGRRP